MSEERTESVHSRLDEYALKRGSSGAGIKLERNGTLWLHLVQGAIIGGVVTFLGRRRQENAFLCRLTHLELGEGDMTALVDALNTSYKSWFGIDPRAPLTLGNPTLLITASENRSSGERCHAFSEAQSCLDLLYADWVVGLSTRPGLMVCDEGHRFAAGAVWAPQAVPDALQPPPKRVPGALLQPHAVDASLAFPGSDGLCSVQTCRANALAWFRRARLEDNLILKFIAYWISMEACFPPGRRVKLPELRDWIGMLFGHIEEAQSVTPGPDLVRFLAKHQTNTNEFRQEWPTMCRLRAGFVHFGAGASELAAQTRTDLCAALHLLRIHIVPSCLDVLEDAESEGVHEIERIWPNHALAYVMSGRFRRRGSFRTSFYSDVPRELAAANDHST